MRLLPLALLALFLAGCTFVPVPVPVAVAPAAPTTPATLAEATFVVGENGAALYDGRLWNGAVIVAPAGHVLPIVGVDPVGEWLQVRLHDRLLWTEADDGTAHNVKSVPVLWP